MATTRTSTASAGVIRLKGVAESPKQLPTAIQERIAALRKLSTEQAGHLRHFHNLASQLDGDWSFFGSQEPGQEWLDAIRYQLAWMAYGTAAAHFHLLPSLRGPLRELFQKLIRKMLRREVWGYWYLTSQSGILVDPDLKEMRKPWADPIVRENIMYSGHLLLMLSLYEMLFDSDEYEEEGSVTFNWDPIFWGFGPEKFQYSRRSIQDVILKEMEKNGWVGVCCEPNMVFVVCNQFPIIAMRYADVRYGTDIVHGVLEKYEDAIKRKGMIHEEGAFAEAWRVKQDVALPAGDICFTAWACAFMNGWNSDKVHALYPSQAVGALTKREDGRVNVERPTVAAIIRAKAKDGADPDATATRVHALQEANSSPQRPQLPYGKPLFGCIAAWLSEVAPSNLNGLLKHADAYLNPSWSKGGLYYPRNDTREDLDGNWLFVDPVTGNGAIGYSRLNVPDGQKKMWENAWTSEHVRGSVAIEDVGFASDVDFLRCQWVTESELGFTGLLLTMRTWNGETKVIRPKVVGLPAGTYDVYIEGSFARSHTQNTTEKLSLELVVTGEESSICILKSGAT